MKSLPTSAELGFLKSKDLILVSFAKYQVYLTFEDEIVITIEGLFRHVHGGCVDVGLENDAPVAESKLMRLIGHQIIELDLKGQGDLELSFSNEDTLLIFRDAEPYESYHIRWAEKEIHV